MATADALTSLGLAYAILVPDEVHNWMRRTAFELHERYGGDPYVLVLPPHVTIKQPFEAAELEPFEHHFDRLVAETEPFELVLRGFGYFEREGVVFLDVEQDERLRAIQVRVLHDLAEHGIEPAPYESGEPVPYHFHATVAVSLDDAALADARERYRETPEFRFLLERIGLFRRTAEGWTLYKRVRAGS